MGPVYINFLYFGKSSLKKSTPNLTSIPFNNFSKI